MDETFFSVLTPAEQAVFESLQTPAQIQAYMDQIPYNPEYQNRSPRSMMRDRIGHCLDGVLFAAAALRRLGHRPLVMDMLPEPGMDDDHMMALYRVNGLWGAVAKSNYVGLRFREPVYRTPRELVLSYFEVFFNGEGVKTLRYYTLPFDLRSLDSLQWLINDAAPDELMRRINRRKRVRLFPEAQANEFTPLNEITYQAFTMGINPDGIYKPH